MALGQAQRRPAVLRLASRLTYLRSRWTSAPDHYPADALAQRPRLAQAPERRVARVPDRRHRPRQRAGRQLPAQNAGGTAAALDPDHDRPQSLRSAGHHPLARRPVWHVAADGRGNARLRRRPPARPGRAPPARRRRLTSKPTTAAATPCWPCCVSPADSNRSEPG